MSVYKVAGVTESDGEVYKLLPRGIYPAEIISSEWGEVTREDSKYLGTVYLKLGIRVNDDDSGISTVASEIIMLPNESCMDGEEIRRSLARLARLQTACGLQNMGDDIDNDAFLHCEFRAEVSVKEDETYGKQQTIRDYLPL